MFFRGSDPLNPAEIDSMFENLEISTSSSLQQDGKWTSKNANETKIGTKNEDESKSKNLSKSQSEKQTSEKPEESCMLKKSPENTFLSAEKPDSESELSKVSVSPTLNLPTPGKRLQSLMNRVNTVQTTSLGGSSASFSYRSTLSEPEENSGFSSEMRSEPGNEGSNEALNAVPVETLLEQLVHSVAENSSNNQYKNQNTHRTNNHTFLSEESENTETEAEIKAENENENKNKTGIERENDVLKNVRNTSLKSEKKNGKRFPYSRFLFFGFEVSCGLVLGAGLILAILSIQNPLEKRVIYEFQKTLPGTITCDGAENNFMKTEITYGPMFTQDSSEKGTCTDLNILRTDVLLAPISHVSRNLRVRSVSLEGVEFPGLTTLEPQDAWRPNVLSPLFTTQGEELLKVHPDALESLTYLEEVKSKHLPEFQAISKEVARISTEAEAAQKRLCEKLGVQELTPERLEAPDALREDVVADVDKLSALKKEATEIQARWTTLNQTVSDDLSLMKEKIAADGQNFSNILACECPDVDKMNDFLYKTDFEKRTAETSNWVSAVCRMVELGMLSRSSIPADTLKTSGTIELFGQNFTFDGDWNTHLQEECVYSYSGNLRLHSEVIPAELMKDAFVAISCKQKENSNLKTISARIPLVNETFVWGDFKELPLWAKTRDACVVLDLTIFGDEIRGKITLEMNQVSFDVPTDLQTGSCRKEFYTPFEELVLPHVAASAQVSGSGRDPMVTCTGSATDEFCAQCVQTLQNVYRDARKELVSTMYERLKNSETAFNSTIEPFYHEVVLCMKNANVFGEFQIQTPKEMVAERDSKKAQSAENMKSDAGKTTLAQNPKKGKKSTNEKRTAVVEVTPMSLAQMDLSPEDLDENIPMYNPNIGMEPVVEPVAAAVGNPVAVETPKVKVVPVKKVAEITPIAPATPAIPATVPAAQTAVPTAIPAAPAAASETAPVLTPENAPAMIPAATPAAVQSANVHEVIPGENTTSMDGVSEEAPLNVSDPVLYTNSQKKKEAAPVTIPAQNSTRHSTPLPMMKSTSNFGS